MKDIAKSKNKYNNYRKEVANIINNVILMMAIESEEYRMPWHKGMQMAINLKTGRCYNGMNYIRLWGETMVHNYNKNYWATMRQWNRRKCGVIKGQKGTMIFIPIIKDLNGKDIDLKRIDDRSIKSNFPVGYKASFVFNADQVTNKVIGPSLFENSQTARSKIEQICNKANVTINHNDQKAFYSLLYDEVGMPYKANFFDTKDTTALDSYYSTLVHELIHWTGNKQRLNRTNLWKSEEGTAYAFEELIAEFGAAILCTFLENKICPRPDHMKYLKSWLRSLRDIPELMIDAISFANQAVVYLLTFLDDVEFQIKPLSSPFLNEEKKQYLGIE